MITLLSTIIVIGIIVFVHEFGHFAMAKLGGVIVEKFSIGFPPTIFKKKFGETEYAIGAIPFGGYVKLAGEDADRADKPPRPGELSSRPRWIRALIMVAGPTMNFVLAVFLFWAIIAFHGVGEMSHSPVVGGVVEGAPADSAGIEPLDSIIAIDGTPIDSWESLARFVHARPEQELAVEFLRGETRFTRTVIPAREEMMTDTGKVEVGLIGIQPNIAFEPMGVFRAIPASLILMGDVLTGMVDFFRKIFTAGIERGDIGGPILIARMAGASARSGWATFFFFLAALSVNLGILNLLPLPALDGGQLVLIGVEALRRKPLSFKVRVAIQQVGFLIIVALMLYVTFNDIFMLFSR